MELYVGKKIRIKNWSIDQFQALDEELNTPAVDITTDFVTGMHKFVGKTVTINHINDYNENWFNIKEDKGYFLWCSQYVDEIDKCNLSDDNFEI